MTEATVVNNFRHAGLCLGGWDFGDFDFVEFESGLEVLSWYDLWLKFLVELKF